MSLRGAIGLSTVEVEIVGEGAEIVGVVNEAIRRRGKERRRPETAITLRRSTRSGASLTRSVSTTTLPGKRGVDRARTTGLKLAWSNPCFEFWLLLHFVLIGRSFDGYAAIRPALSKHIRNYEKSTNCFERLAPRIPTAIEHSKQIHRSQWQNTPRSIDCNPATTVHELVEKLMEVAEMTVEQYQEQYPLPEVVGPKGKRAGRS